MLVPQPGIEPGLPAVMCWVLTTGPPGNSPPFLIYISVIYFQQNVCISSNIIVCFGLLFMLGYCYISKQCLLLLCQLLGRVWLFGTPWTIAHQPPLSMGFSRQQYWSGLPFLSPGDLPDPGIKPGCLALQADSLPSKPPGEAPNRVYILSSIG